MGHVRRMLTGMVLWGAVVFMGLIDVASAEEAQLIQQQTVYVPVYSHIYMGERARPFQLSTLLSIRNTDPKYPITVTTADYYDTQGKLVKRFIAKPVLINPMGAESIYIKASDTSGGAGANFVVKWRALKPVNEPIIEGVMVGAQSGQGISFVCRGMAIQDQR